MRPVGNRLRARTIGLALVAAFIALEALLALRTGSAGIPGIFLINLTDGRLADAGGGAGAPQPADAGDGGESVIAKRHEAAIAPEPAADETTGSTPPGDGEARLEGLGEIPLKPWIRDDAKSERTRPDASIPAGGGQTDEKLPWDAVEPVPFDDGAPAPSPAKAASEAHVPQTPLAALPAESQVATWVKAKATEVKGADRARPLYHFEIWLEPPEGVRGNLATVTYEFNTPAVMPQSQMSREKETGFRVSAGGLVCADKVTVTLRFRDGRSQRVEVDGCKLVS